MAIDNHHLGSALDKLSSVERVKSESLDHPEMHEIHRAISSEYFPAPLPIVEVEHPAPHSAQRCVEKFVRPKPLGESCPIHAISDRATGEISEQLGNRRPAALQSTDDERARHEAKRDFELGSVSFLEVVNQLSGDRRPH